MSVQSLQEDALSQRNVVPWFPLEEKELLATLVNRYKHILECMKTNGVSLPKKIETWKKVAELYNLSHAVIRCSPGQLKKCWDNMKLSCQEEAAELQRDYYRIGVRASRTMSPLSEQVKAIASHIFTRLFNPYDSDRPGQEHVKNLPVVRIFQPMVDGSCDVESDYTDDQSEPNSPVPEQSEPPVATVSRIAAATAAPEAGQDGDSTSLSIVQPDAPSSIAAEGCSNGSAASGADCSCTIAPGVAAGDSRAPRGRTALLEKTLEIENDLPAALLREEHAVRIHLMQEDHKSVLKERQWKKVFEEQNHRLALQKWKIEFEILQLEKAVKQEQLRRMRGGPK